jgi:hypothetical protein
MEPRLFTEMDHLPGRAGDYCVLLDSGLQKYCPLRSAATTTTSLRSTTIDNEWQWLPEVDLEESRRTVTRARTVAQTVSVRDVDQRHLTMMNPCPVQSLQGKGKPRGPGPSDDGRHHHQHGMCARPCLLPATTTPPPPGRGRGGAPAPPLARCRPPPPAAMQPDQAGAATNSPRAAAPALKCDATVRSLACRPSPARRRRPPPGHHRHRARSAAPARISRPNLKAHDTSKQPAPVVPFVSREKAHRKDSGIVLARRREQANLEGCTHSIIQAPGSAAAGPLDN